MAKEDDDKDDFEMMQAIAIDWFGGPETLKLHMVTIPEPAANEVLIHVKLAGVGVWDPFDREWGFAEMVEREPKFPYVLSSEGAGVISAVGENVDRFKDG